MDGVDLLSQNANWKCYGTSHRSMSSFPWWKCREIFCVEVGCKLIVIWLVIKWSDDYKIKLDWTETVVTAERQNAAEWPVIDESMIVLKGVHDLFMHFNFSGGGGGRRGREPWNSPVMTTGMVCKWTMAFLNYSQDMTQEWTVVMDCSVLRSRCKPVLQ
jgi:hypothetical protein